MASATCIPVVLHCSTMELHDGGAACYMRYAIVIIITGGEAKNVDQLRKELLKKDRSYRILEPSECTPT